MFTGWIADTFIAWMFAQQFVLFDRACEPHDERVIIEILCELDQSVNAFSLTAIILYIQEVVFEHICTHK